MHNGESARTKGSHRESAATPEAKRPFVIRRVLERIGRAIKPFRKAAMFELAEDGFSSPFEQLVACIISIRTYDEVTIPCARRLFGRARAPASVLALSLKEIDRAIAPCTFHEAKAKQIRDIAERVEREFHGVLPCDREAILSFRGVGPKCANLTLGVACGDPQISVDIHVHRVVNRWGYIRSGTPDKAMSELEKVLPKKFWIEINRLLVPFGKHICTGVRPKCSTCPVVDMCQQIGVTDHR